ncbi:hypothetical protein B0H10DRAFT_134399 [Mycena sp. CBHHK59/15]|nr:hypothetical protein B0H10DRAFT_134399 [Mycena sp. CBHHK59/15]
MLLEHPMYTKMFMGARAIAPTREVTSPGDVRPPVGLIERTCVYAPFGMNTSCACHLLRPISRRCAQTPASPPATICRARTPRRSRPHRIVRTSAAFLPFASPTRPCSRHPPTASCPPTPSIVLARASFSPRPRTSLRSSGASRSSPRKLEPTRIYPVNRLWLLDTCLSSEFVVFFRLQIEVLCQTLLTNRKCRRGGYPTWFLH